MLNKTDLLDMKKTFLKNDAEREKLIIQSRSIIKLSKQIIYSVHRDDLSGVSSLVKQIEAKKKESDLVVSKNSHLLAVGAYRVGIGEYVEAMLYYGFVKTGELASHKKLKVSADNYLFGLCDLAGELNRRAVFLAGKGKVAEVSKIRDLVDTIYGALLEFDIRENELRRKVDAVKYELKKLEDLVLALKLRK